MILTLNLECLDPEITKFYEQESNKSLIQDALIHGYKIVNSSTYGLNFENSRFLGLNSCVIKIRVYLNKSKN